MQDDVTVAEAAHDAQAILYKIHAAGTHFAVNGLGALAAAVELGADLALSIQGLGRWRPYSGRGARERVYLDPIDDHLTLDLIDESYNANPTSMAAALEVLAAARVTHDIGRVSRGRRIAILGDMKELGPEGLRMHAAMADLTAMASVDVVHCVGPLSESLYHALPSSKRGHYSATATEMAEMLRGRLDCGDVVMVKGSLSMGLAQVVAAIRNMGHARGAEAE